MINSPFNNNFNIIQDIENNVLNVETHDVLNEETHDVLNEETHDVLNDEIIFYDNKIELYNKCISITLHVFIMVIFEIYFYFNYVIAMERNVFLSKINNYFTQLMNVKNDDDINNYLLHKIINSKQIILLQNQLYEEYINSLHEQEELIKKLLVNALILCGIIGIIVLIFFINGLYNYKFIKWKWILIENIFMLLFLGFFEYMFFINIILKYNPITDNEIKYIVINNFINYFNSTS
jgi:hypothetical protein